MVEALINPFKSEVLTQQQEHIREALKEIEYNVLVLPASEIFNFISQIENSSWIPNQMKSFFIPFSYSNLRNIFSKNDNNQKKT
jgi:predicted metal-dependent phosphoesterase TrpH